MHAKRKPTYLTKVHPDDLPPFLLAGLPGGMSRCIHTTFWGKDKADIKTSDDIARVKIGLPKDNKEDLGKLR